MTKAKTLLLAFLPAFAAALSLATAVGSPNGVGTNEPRYRLDANYHHLPAKLVADLLAHPPKASWWGPRVKCETVAIDGERIGFCICFGPEACADPSSFQTSANPIELWECIAPLGLIDNRNTGVCRAEPVKITITG